MSRFTRIGLDRKRTQFANCVLSLGTLTKPRPTLWRTCRALANRRRLELLWYVTRCGPLRVGEVAHALRWPRALASQYLRALNARGLLRAERRGRYTRYRASPDPGVPHARAILQALPGSWVAKQRFVATVFRAATGFTHPRRIVIARALSLGPLRVADLSAYTRLSPQVLRRHLDKLQRRGYVVRRGNWFACARPQTAIGRALLGLALREPIFLEWT